MGINVGRVIGGGLLAGGAMNFVDFLVNGVWLAERWKAEALALNARLVDPAIEAQSVMGWVTTDFLLGILTVWAYAAMRPRFGAGPATAVKASVLVWGVAHIAWAAFVFLGLFSLGTVAMSAVGGLVAALVGGYAGASIYKEDGVLAARTMSV